MTELVEKNIEEIIKTINEASKRFNKKQVSVDTDRVFRKYSDKILALSDWHIDIRRFGNDTNIEVGHYKVSVIIDNEEDREIYKQYLREYNED